MWRLVEVDLLEQVAKDGHFLAPRRLWVLTPIRFWIKPLPTQEDILDEFQGGVEAEDLLINVALAGIRADHQSRHAKAVAGLVNPWKSHVIEETAPLIPGNYYYIPNPVIAWPH